VIVGLTSPLAATGLYGVAGKSRHQFSIDVTTLASWSVLDNTGRDSGQLLDHGGPSHRRQAGSTTVTATLSGKTGQATVNVVATSWSLLRVTTHRQRSGGPDLPFQATGTFDNTTTRNITADVPGNPAP